MAAFTFRLEQVRLYRKQLEDQAMQAFAVATAYRDSIQQRLLELREELAIQRDKLFRAEELTAAERWLSHNYEMALQEDIEIASEQLIEAEEAVRQRKVAMISCMQDRKLLDTLKDKQAQRHAQQEQLKEQREYDEIATLRFTATPR